MHVLRLLARQAHEGENYLDHFTLPSPIHARAELPQRERQGRAMGSRDRPAPEVDVIALHSDAPRQRRCPDRGSRQDATRMFSN
jgi:hypothetical protein